ncbi:MAG TPA: molybdopterin oxidoreductase family protein [Thermoanaerobaculia bacterium]|nr:molybdopterin oxidoreductase family protein [Thermoanaerobaculia bacterium]
MASPAADRTQTHLRTCTLCEAMCGLEIRLEHGEITAIRGDRDDPFSRGHICPKATALEDVHRDPDRLRQPLKRVGSDWQRISWEEALAETAERLTEVGRRHGRDAIAVYFGNPTVHNWGSALFGRELPRALGTRNRYSATSVDQLPHHVVANFLYGHPLLLPVPDLDRTAFLLLLGANPVASNGSLMTAPDVTRRLKAIRERGGRLVVVDPRRTETAAIADQHLFIRPGTDALLLLSLLHVILEEGRARPGRLRDLTDGWQAVAEVARRFPPERVAGPVGIAPDEIRALARDFAGAETAACYGRMGLSTQAFGTLCQWLTQVLNVVTGNLDRAGGTMFTRPAFDLVRENRRADPTGRFGKRRTRVRGLPGFAGELPVAALAEEILTPGPGQVRALVTAAGNPVLSTPNGRQLERALEGLDFMVSIDFYLNETTRHAHLILPPTSPLEHDHYDLVFHLLAIRNTAKYSPALFAPEPGAKHDWEIFLDLAARLDRRRGFAKLAAWPVQALQRRLGPRLLLRLALRFGPWGPGWNPLGEGLTLGRLEKAPHGIDLGELEPCLPGRLATLDRRIHLAPEPLVADLERLEERLLDPAAATPTNGSLLLLGRRHIRSNNSWMHNSLRLVKGRPRCTLLMHPEDAARRGLADGERAQVTSRVGSVELAVEVTDAIMPGVVSIPHGWGHDRPGTALGVAREHAGVSVNDLTDELLLDDFCGNAALNGVPVAVVAAPRPSS